MEIGNIITFEGEDWFLEDIKHIEENKDLLILSKTESALTNQIEIIPSNNFDRLFSNHPLPWTLHEKSWLEFPCIRDANDTLVINADWEDVDLLEFIVDSANKWIELE